MIGDDFEDVRKKWSNEFVKEAKNAENTEHFENILDCMTKQLLSGFVHKFNKDLMESKAKNKIFQKLISIQRQKAEHEKEKITGLENSNKQLCSQNVELKREIEDYKNTVCNYEKNIWAWLKQNNYLDTMEHCNQNPFGGNGNDNHPVF